MSGPPCSPCRAGVQAFPSGSAGSPAGLSVAERRICVLEKVNFPGLEAVSLPRPLASVAGERDCLFLWGVFLEHAWQV